MVMANLGSADVSIPVPSLPSPLFILSVNLSTRLTLSHPTRYRPLQKFEQKNNNLVQCN